MLIIFMGVKEHADHIHGGLWNMPNIFIGGKGTC